MSFVSFTTEAYRNKVETSFLTPAALLNGGGEAMAAWKRSVSNAYNAPAVRRPLGGVEIKERTPANISVLRNDGTPIMLNNMVGASSSQDYAWLSEYAGAPEVSPLSGANHSAFYTDFSILQLQEAREERMQVIETFGENFAFFFGERPRFLSMGGVLVNSKDFPWRALWWENYEKYLRGTRCVENRARVYLAWDDVLIEGYIVSAQCTDHSAEPNSIPFTFTMLLTKHTSLTALNLSSIMEANTAAFQSKRGEILGSLAADVRNNGQAVEIDEGFFLNQVAAKLDLPTTTEAYEVARRYGLDALSDLASAAGQAAQSAASAMRSMLGGKSVYSSQAPLNALWSSMAETDSAGVQAVEGIPVDTLSSLETTRKVFGSSLERLHSLDVL